MQRVARAIFCALTGSAVAVYLFAVSVHVIPTSAATYEIRKVTDHWLGPLFTQRWSMFAPNPPTANMETWAQAEYIDLSGAVRRTEWFDISSYLSSVSKSRPLTPSRVYRMAANVERNLLTHDTAEDQHFVRRPPTREQIEARVQPLKLRHRELSLRLASQVLRGHAGPGERLASLQIQLAVIPIPRFGTRDDPPTLAQYLAWASGWRSAPEETGAPSS